MSFVVTARKYRPQLFDEGVLLQLQKFVVVEKQRVNF